MDTFDVIKKILLILKRLVALRAFLLGQSVFEFYVLMYNSRTFEHLVAIGLWTFQNTIDMCF